jgi:hypothetical protein
MNFLPSLRARSAWWGEDFFAIMTSKHALAFSRREASEVCQNFLTLEKQRAQGMPGARCARSLAWDKKQTTRA